MTPPLSLAYYALSQVLLESSEQMVVEFNSEACEKPWLCNIRLDDWSFYKGGKPNFLEVFQNNYT